MFGKYHTRCVWKIVAKPPLFQSQRYWISFNPTIGGVPVEITNSPNDLVGFEWNPAEENELYVTTPWSSLDYMSHITDFSNLGQLIITPRTGLVTEDLLPAPLQISTFVAPLDMTLYDPMPIDSSHVPDLDVHYRLDTYISNTNDTLKLNSTTDVNVYPTDAYADGATTVTHDQSGDYIYSSTVASVSLSPVVMQNQDTITIDNSLAQLSLTLISTAPFIFNGEGARRVLLPLVVEEFILTSTTSLDLIDTIHTTYSAKLTTASTLPAVTATINGNYWFSSAVTGLSNTLKDTYTTGAASIVTDAESTDIAEFKVYAIGPAVSVFKDGRSNWEYNSYIGEQQIGTASSDLGYAYDPNFTKNKQVYGSMGDHSARLDNQWGLITTMPVALTSDQLIIDFNLPQEQFCNYDRDRHLFFSKFPSIKASAAITPASAMLLRLTQTHSSEPLPLEDIFQLPGIEWDPKNGPIIFKPFWTNDRPAVGVSDINNQEQFIQVDVLAGTIGTTAEIAFWYNTKDLDYHHLIGIDQITAEPAAVRTHGNSYVGEQQSGTIAQISKVSPDNGDGSTTSSERRWNYVSTIKVNQTDAIIQIPVNSRLFGKWSMRQAARYSKWQGNLRLKFAITNASVLNGNIHVTHQNAPVIGGTVIKADTYYQILGDIGHDAAGAPGEAVELDVQWRTTQPFLTTDPSSNISQNGYITIVIPEFSYLSSQQVSSVITIYADSSALQYSLPRSSSLTGDYVPIKPTIYQRA
jgi:hypothetical protein